MKLLVAIIPFLKDIEFANPYCFLLLLLLIPIVGWHIWKRRRMQADLILPTTTSLENAPKSWRQRLLWLPNTLRVLIFFLVVIALARPQSHFSTRNVETEGIDIVLALDISASMRTMDFKPNRLEACKAVAEEFISTRPNDRIGIVVYGEEAYTICPVTSDHSTLSGMLETVDFNNLENSTAIGDGLGTAINRLRDSEAKSKVTILLSDGVNNSGYIDPYAAAEMAKNHKIKVYTIGCGSYGQAPIPTPYGPQLVQTEIDEKLLNHIAETTGGKYFRATNKEKLRTIYQEIDTMEKTKISESVFESKTDIFFPFLLAAVVLFLAELLLRLFVLRVNP